MIKSIMFVILIVNSFSLINCDEKLPALSNVCAIMMDLVTNGTYGKFIEDITVCKNNLPQYVYNTLTQCENLLPLSTNAEVIKVCSDIGIYAKKFEQTLKCYHQIDKDNYNMYWFCMSGVFSKIKD
ncbi:uncharacterized protein LOC128392595 isoform X2 [Panonychus citri]|uniref:uncharacterized protein LOC128392595 isoform X2 n=1 Tax=Panonychus citri TaxID=50023 RepID=UPI002307D1D4|nr:uncharacterized protein LOC128392595 isoform X2 [Panonychus citri]